MGSIISRGKNVKTQSDVKNEARPVESKQEIKTEVKITVAPKETEVKLLEERDDAIVATVVVDTSFSHQTGGHVGAFTKLDDGKIMKKVGKNEYNFYSAQLPHHDSIREFVPACYGTEIKEDTHYVIIEDLTRKFKKPCILDIKMGTSSVGEDASPEKRELMHKKDMGTTTCSLGVRITAMKIYQADKQDYVSYGKDWGKNVTDANFLESLIVYFNNGKEIRRSLAPLFLEKLLKVQGWINSQTALRIYSSSLLFIYDGEDSDEVELKMIDFAHVHEITDGGKDDGYITGMNNLIEFMKQI